MANVLVACEESQEVCKAFRAHGHNAFSCDLQAPSGGHPEWHIQGDALELLDGGAFCTTDGIGHYVMGWDLLIAHPPCTYLSNAGACRLYPNKGKLDEARYKKGLAAKKFFLKFYGANIPHIAVENPMPSTVFELPLKSQVIQPYEFGHPFSKKTYLWLKGLPLLEPTNVITEDIHPYVNGNAEMWKRDAKNGKVWGKEKSSRHRSKTFSGIAEAMAEQWGDFIEKEGK